MATAFTDQDDFYKMDASPKGICLIINNFEFELSDYLDAGPANRENLNRIFQELDFEVRYFENLTCEQIKTQMGNIKKTNHSNYNCFVCCICSHGGKKGVCGSDDYTVTVSELQSYVYTSECPSLAGKPKVFFVDTCRGGEGHRGLYQPLAPAQGRRAVITDKRDFLLSFATTPDNVSWSNSRKGSVFFYHLTMLLKRHATSKPVVRILHMLNEALTNERPEQHLQTAEYTSTLAKELRFHHPVQAMITASRPAPLRKTAVAKPSRPTHPQTKAFRFHDNHGEKVVLSNNQQTAQYRVGVYGYGIVMSRDPMEVNKLYEVNITKRDRGVWALHVGVVTSSQDSLTLPYGAGGWESAVAVYSDCFSDHGDLTNTDIGQALIDLPVDSRMGLRLDSNRSLHLHVNGADQGVVPCRPLPDQCWALWQLNSAYKELTSLPVRYLA